METLNYWEQFEHTGKVEDYLSYVSEISVSEGTAAIEKRGETDKAGVNPYAGIHMGNRNDIKTDACRGI